MYIKEKYLQEEKQIVWKYTKSKYKLFNTYICNNFLFNRISVFNIYLQNGLLGALTLRGYTVTNKTEPNLT